MTAALSLDDIRAAADRLDGRIERTPCRYSRTLSAITGAEVWVKFENLQFTASFKERGALNKLLQLTEAEKARGVIAASRYGPAFEEPRVLCLEALDLATEALRAGQPLARFAVFVAVVAVLLPVRGALVGAGRKFGPQPLVEAARRGQRAAGGIVDHLGVDVLAGAEHRQARPPNRFLPQLEPQAVAPPVPKLLLSAHYFFLPSLRRIVSASYFTPLPL